MKYALVNPPWDFTGSIYFGCRDPHLPLEFGYSRALLTREGHDVLLVDASIEGLDMEAVRDRVKHFGPDITVITTAPTYLFWRCPPPELRSPLRACHALRDMSPVLVAVGPHGSTTPHATLTKLPVDAVVMGECEEVLPRLAGDWRGVMGLAYRKSNGVVVQGGPQAAGFDNLPVLHWESHFLHEHHHHRFDEPRVGLGAEMEASRGCPYACSFCAKDNFRDAFRRRPLANVLAEIDALIQQGVGYVYFVDEIFLPQPDLLEALVDRPVNFGIQTRIDLWKPDMLDLLGHAGCVSIEAGIESVSDLGRLLLNKNCKLDADALRARLLHARRTVPFVQASLLDSGVDDSTAVEEFRQSLLGQGVWVNKPVPMFPYPGSPGYTEIWGPPDDHAWERAHEHYLGQFSRFSDIQDERPLPLARLERLDS
jgi:B12-binding domain/radical SAM domain protein of rhizo-twelve system